jgi:hypothetical protein
LWRGGFFLCKFVFVMGNDRAPTVLVRQRDIDLLERAALFEHGGLSYGTYNSPPAF